MEMFVILAPLFAVAIFCGLAVGLGTPPAPVAKKHDRHAVSEMKKEVVEKPSEPSFELPAFLQVQTGPADEARRRAERDQQAAAVMAEKLRKLNELNREMQAAKEAKAAAALASAATATSTATATTTEAVLDDFGILPDYALASLWDGLDEMVDLDQTVLNF